MKIATFKKLFQGNMGIRRKFQTGSNMCYILLNKIQISYNSILNV